MSPTEDAVVTEDVADVHDEEHLAAAPNVTVTDTDVTDDQDDSPGDFSEADAEAAFEDAIRARLELETERIRREERAAHEQRIREDTARRAAEADAARFRDSFATATRESFTAWQNLKVYDEDGRQVKLTEDDFQRVVAAPYQKHNATVQAGVMQGLLQDLAQAALSVIPEADRPTFTERASGKPIDEWLRLVAEHLAPSTEYAKLSTKEIEAKLKAAEARGIAKGRKMPAGTPPQGGERAPGASSSQPDLNTHLGLARALHLGRIDEAEYRERRAKLE